MFGHALSKPGIHMVKLTVTDPTALTASASATVTVAKAPPPALTALKQSHKRWRRRTDTTFSFGLSAAATVRLVFSSATKHRTDRALTEAGPPRPGPDSPHGDGGADVPLYP
jgi:hypothetical protein